MKKTSQLICVMLAAGIYSTANASCTDGTGCLQVPGDFSSPVNHFSMNLLGGEFHVDGYGLDYDYNTGDPFYYWFNVANSTTNLNTTGKKIDFTATQFDHVGPGQGTSTLSANFNHYEIGSGMFLGYLATIYIDGTANGALVDNATSTQGHWTLDTHLYADWSASSRIDLGVISLSTNASYNYATINSDNICMADTEVGCSALTGSIMDYHSGLAYLVGQGVIPDPAFSGFRITYGLQGLDPVASTVPVPAAAWLLGSGLIGLAGFAKKRKTA